MTTTVIQTLTHVTCYECGLLFGIESEYNRKLVSLKTQTWFTCPAGHKQHYVGESDSMKVARLDREKQEEINKVRRLESDAKILRDEAFKANEKTKRLRTAIKKKSLRIKNGVCPHCDRSFENLQRHMTTKHTTCKSAKGYKVKKSKLP